MDLKGLSEWLGDRIHIGYVWILRHLVVTRFHYQLWFKKFLLDMDSETSSGDMTSLDLHLSSEAIAASVQPDFLAINRGKKGAQLRRTSYLVVHHSICITSLYKTQTARKGSWILLNIFSKIFLRPVDGCTDLWNGSCQAGRLPKSVS